MANIDINGRDYKVIEFIASRNSGGRLSKLWIEDTNGNQWLVKGSTSFAYEPFSEVMAHKIGQALGLDALDYTLVKSSYFNKIIKNYCKYVSVCPSINIYGNEVMSITHIKNSLNMKQNQDKKYQYTNKEVMEEVMSKEAIDRLLFFDAIIGNKDRHYRNVHIIRNIKGEFIEAPLMDNGDSLLATDIFAGVTGNILAERFDKSCTIERTHAEQVKYITTIDTSNWDIESIVNNILYNINPILQLMPKLRANAVKRYIVYRLHKYIGLFKNSSTKQRG